MSQPSGNDDPTIQPEHSPAVKPNHDAVTAASQGDRPKFFGRYRVVSMLGKGGCGAVYRAVDDQLQRDVAIKVTLGSMLDPSLRQGFLTEARIVAALDHPSIVPVYDVGQTDNGDFFVVSKLIDGSDLSSRIKLDRPDRIMSLRIIEQMADALNYAHAKGLVHRDVKPANILLDCRDRPYLTDFGIALRESEQRREGDSAGTPAYMSPEQARGEGHRIDNRSDIYSLGVVLYELLTGRRPFRSDSPLDLMMLVATEEVRSPRLFDDTISLDLERICMKALARRASDRFTVSRDFAEEIRWLLTQNAPTPGVRPSAVSFPAGVTPVTPAAPNTAELAAHVTDATPTGPTRIVPKGLRSFDASDASFFLELLPGPFDRDGLPEGLRFWKARIEETDPEKTFRVGLVYGPSGCGKSSLMKAGLLPRLSTRIIPIYIEATPDDTETGLLRGVRKAIPDAKGASLKEVLSTIRRRRLVPSGGKLLLVLDQFEQWLFAEKSYAKASLTDALLQCDGSTVQAIVMVREDFWISVSRFLRELDVPIVERQNSAMVDLFDLDHSAKVLGLFGKAYGKLPDSTKYWNQDQNEFVRQAIQGLSHDEKVISVRIALLADMMKQKAWTTAALQAVGGIEGVGVTFLDEMFGSRHAPIQHRQHQEAVRGLLSALLPPSGTDIKGSLQSTESLQKAAGYEQKPREFQDLLAILDNTLRLITPVDDSSGADGSTSRSYQLAHDYMVPSLRQWLTQKQRETKNGRAELKLAERAAAWGVNKESKQLPTFVEWLQIRRFTETVKWKAGDKAVMQQATRYHMQRVALAAATVVFLASGGWFAWRESSRQQEAIRIAGLVDTLTNAQPTQIPEIVDKLNVTPQVAQVADKYLAPKLTVDGKTPEDQRARLHARLASVQRDPSLVDPLVDELLTGKVNYVLPIRQVLKPSVTKIRESLQGLLQDEKGDPQRRFRAALALADYVPPSDEATWTESHRAFVAEQLVSSNAELQPTLREALRPIQDKLLSDLERIFGDLAASDAQRLGAANALADYAVNDLGRVTQLLTVATPEQHAVLYPVVSAVPSPETIAQLSQIAAMPPPEDLGSIPRIAYGQRRANAAVTMLRLGEKEKVLPVFDWTDDPEAMMQFIVRCKPRGITIDTLLDLLAVPTRSVSEGSNHARYALLLALGEYAPSDVPPARRDALVKQLADWYANDPNSGVHGASGWLLRHLGEKEIADRVDQTPVPYSPDREWFNLAITVSQTAVNSMNSSVVAQQPAKRSLNSDEEPLVVSSGDNPVDKTQLPLPGEKNSWLAVDSSLATQIQSAEGFITDSCGLCQSLPLEQFIRLSEDLRASGYRPTRVRPYLKTNDIEGKLSEVLVAAIWMRDGGEWLVQMDLSAEEIREQNELLSKKGMIVLDVAGYPGESPEGPSDKYIGIWGSSARSRSDLLVGVSDVEHDAAWKAMKQRGFSVRTRQCFGGVNGQIMHAQVWCSPADQQWELWEGDRAFYERKLSSQTVLADVCVFDRRTTDPSSKRLPEPRYAFVFNSSARGVLAKECHDVTPSQHLAVCRSLESEGFRPVSLSVHLTGGDYRCASIWHRSIPPRTFYYTFIVHPKGEYTIGSLDDEPFRSRAEVRHTVTLTRPFALLDREITFEELIAFSPQYAEVMKQNDATPSDAGTGVHWYNSVAFCRWLGKEMGLPESEQCYADPERLDRQMYPRESDRLANWAPRDWPVDLSKRGFRLPTESEWEVMARSGSRTAYGFGSEVALLDRFGWFTENSGKKVHPGREKRPSVRGLFDVHGNLYEWTHDWMAGFGNSSQTDPLGSKTGSYRVFRGGAWDVVAGYCRTANRSNGPPTSEPTNRGFRLALSPSGIPK